MKQMKYLLTKIIILFSLLGIAQSYQEVKEYIYDCDSLEHKEIVLRQAILETGWFESYNCVKRNNLFGFRHRGGYLVFNHWQESIDYYIKWQYKYYNGGDYYAFLEDIGYASSPTYTQKLKSITIR